MNFIYSFTCGTHINNCVISTFFNSLTTFKLFLSLLSKDRTFIVVGCRGSVRITTWGELTTSSEDLIGDSKGEDGVVCV